MSRRSPLSDSKWAEETSQINENFIKSYNDDSDEGCFLEVDVQYHENFYKLHNNLPFLPETMKI